MRAVTSVTDPMDGLFGEIDALREAAVIGVNPTGEAPVTTATGPPADPTPIA